MQYTVKHRQNPSIGRQGEYLVSFNPKAISYKRADIPLTIRFTEPLYEQLCALRKQTESSLNSIILQACEYALQDLPADLKPPQE